METGSQELELSDADLEQVTAGKGYALATYYLYTISKSLAK